VERDAISNAMGEIFVQGGNMICYHVEMFHRVFLNYPEYDEEHYSLVQDVNKWKYYLTGMETIIHIDHQPL